MRILIVAATMDEVAPLVSSFDEADRRATGVTPYTFAGHDVDLLTTGVGMVATAAWCAHALAERPYDLALNVGVCGAFDQSLGPGSVVHTISDRLAELGAEDGDTFLTIDELGLVDRDGRSYSRSDLLNAAPPVNRVLGELPRVAGITVNTVHGNERSIAAVARFRPQVESMEGAAFMYVCLMHDIPFAQVRGVSNMVERRNRAAWRMAEAIGNLAAVVVRILEAA